MSFLKKIWTDRISEYPNRRMLTNEDNTTNVVTVARDEGTISQPGDAFSATNMNDLENRIEDGFNELNSNLFVYKVVNFTLMSTSGDTSYTLPDGFTNANCAVINTIVQNANGTWYSNVGATIYPGRFNNVQSTFYNRPAKAILYKFA